jgi:peptidoglycan hydrolase CwlO-like protein
MYSVVPNMNKQEFLNMVREEIGSIMQEFQITEAPANTNQAVLQPGQEQPVQQDPRLQKMQADMQKLEDALEQLNGKKAPIDKRIAVVNQEKARLQKRMDDISKSIERNQKTM